MNSRKPCGINKQKKYILLTGIESPEKLLEFLSSEKIHFNHLKFRDHYNFKQSDIENIINQKKAKYSKELL